MNAFSNRMRTFSCVIYILHNVFPFLFQCVQEEEELTEIAFAKLSKVSCKINGYENYNKDTVEHVQGCHATSPWISSNIFKNGLGNECCLVCLSVIGQVFCKGKVSVKSGKSAKSQGIQLSKQKSGNRLKHLSRIREKSGKSYNMTLIQCC